MAGHLRPVPPLPAGPTYVVGRTRHAGAGTPYVVAQCVDEAVAAEPALAEALERWEAHDHRAHDGERSARVALGRVSRDARRSPHPSVLGKLLP